MQNMETGLVGGEPRTWYFHPAETAHVRLTFRCTRPRAAPVFQLDHFLRGMINKVFHHVLFAQPVTAGDGVVEVVIQ